MIKIPEYKISYTPVPKNACTSLKFLFFFIENGLEFGNMRRNGKVFHIHNYYGSTKFNSRDFEAVSDFWKICVIRDPISRFLSAYSNRVLFHGELSERRLGKRAIADGAIPNPTLSQFVDRLDIYRRYSPSIEDHTDLQVTYLGSDSTIYDRAYHMHEIPELVSDLESRINTPLLLQRRQTGGEKISPDELGPEHARKLKAFYQEDYDCLFGRSPI
jgi:hypothetical protein